MLIYPPEETQLRFRYNEYMAHHYAYMTCMAEVREPESYIESANDANCHIIMEEEMCALAENKTWDLIDGPKGIKSIGYKWVYKVNYNTNGSGNRYKARLVAKGYAQQCDIDYDDTFALVTKTTIFRVLLMVAAGKRWHFTKIWRNKECVPTRRARGTSVHGTAPQISVRTEHFSSIPAEEVPLRTKASPVCLEHEDHTTTVLDGVCDVQIELLIVRPARSTWVSSYFTLC